MRKNDRARHRRHREKRNEGKRVTQYARRKWEKKNPDIKSAHQKVRRAVKSGKLTREPCEVCGSEIVHAHHDDYSKPLEVRWLCPHHHSVEHSEYKHEWENYERKGKNRGLDERT